MSEPNFTPEQLRELDELRRDIGFGLDVQQFVGQPLGRYLLRRADVTRQHALEDLADADPSDRARIADLQLRARVPQLFRQWIEDAIAFGENAERAFIAAHEADPTGGP